MANQDDEAGVLLQYRVDQQSVQAAIQANQAVADSVTDASMQIKSVAEQLADLGVTGDQVFTSSGDSIATGLTAPVDEADASVKTLIRDIGDLGRDIQSIPEPPMSAFGLDEGGGGGGGGGLNPRALTTLGRLVGGTPGRALRGVGQATRLADMLPEDTAALQQLGLAAGIAAPAIILTVVALKNYTDQINAQKVALDGALAADTKYYTALTTLTSDQAQKEIDSSNSRLAALQTQKDELQGAIDSAFAQMQQQFGDAGARALVAAGQSPITQLQKQLDDVNNAMTTTTDYAARLAQGLNNDAFAIQDLQAQADATTKKQVAGAQLTLAADQLTADQRKTKIALDMQEIQTLGDLIQHGNLSVDTQDQLLKQQSSLQADFESLIGVTYSYADSLKAVEDATKLQSKQTDNYLAALKTEGDIRDQIAADNQKLATDQANFYAKDDAATAAANEKALTAEADAGDKRATIVQDNADKIAKIERDAGQQMFDDVANRDALAYVKDQQKAQTAIADQQTASAKQLAAVDTALAKTEAAITKSLNDQYFADYQAYQKQTDLVNQDLAQRQVDLLNAQNNEMAIAQYGSGGLIQIEANLWQQRISLAQAAQAAIFAASLPQGGLPGIGGFNPSGTGNITYADIPAFNAAVDRRISQTINSNPRQTSLTQY